MDNTKLNMKDRVDHEIIDELIYLNKKKESKNEKIFGLGLLCIFYFFLGFCFLFAFTYILFYSSTTASNMLRKLPIR